MRTPSLRAAALAAGTAALTLAAGVPTTASAATPVPTGTGHPARSVSVGEPVPAPPFLSPAGDVCPFPVAGEFPVNEQRATVVRNPDGSTRAQYVSGRLVGRFTNTASGRTVERDLSGVGAVTFRPDGSSRLAVAGGALVGFHVGDSPAGIFEVNGPRSVVVVDFAADGTRTRRVQIGPYEDLCATLG